MLSNREIFFSIMRSCDYGGNSIHTESDKNAPFTWCNIEKICLGSSEFYDALERYFFQKRSNDSSYMEINDSFGLGKAHASLQRIRCGSEVLFGSYRSCF